MDDDAAPPGGAVANVVVDPLPPPEALHAFRMPQRPQAPPTPRYFPATQRLLSKVPPTLAYFAVSAAACWACAVADDVSAPSLLSGVFALIGTHAGQISVANLVISTALLSLRVLLWAVFGRLRSIEWQRFWERMASYLMGQLVVLGAVVEPDLAEFCLWGGLSASVGLLGLCAGLARDRLEYMAHLPELPSAWAFGRVIGLAASILAASFGLSALCLSLLWEAPMSTLTLFLFPCWLLCADTAHALVHVYLQRAERLAGSSDLLYYAALVPELGLQCCRLAHHLHVWYVHGLSFSVIDVLLLASTKLAVESLHRRCTTHRNFLRADANLRERFRDAMPDELAKLDDCCAICREDMAHAKVCGPPEALHSELRPKALCLRPIHYTPSPRCSLGPAPSPPRLPHPHLPHAARAPC